MVYELKPPVDGSPGLLIFTHKERDFFLDAPPVLDDRIRRLKERYVLGMQWGRYHAGVGETPLVDFHLACPGTVEFRDDADVRHIRLCSRNFTPDYFRPMDVPVTWDLVSVGHPIEDKRFSDLLDVVRAVYDRGHDLTILLICAIPEKPGKPRKPRKPRKPGNLGILGNLGKPEKPGNLGNLGGHWDLAFFEKYRTLFSDAERANIHLAAPVESGVGDVPLHPIPNEVFPYLYNASRAFTLFSEEEGQSKVLHEALLCGTPVVVREDLRGGGRDYLDERNSRTFATLEEARNVFIDVATNPDAYGFDPSYLRPELAEGETADRLEAEIATVFEELGHEYRGEIEKENLAFKLGSHTITLPPELRRGNTNDLRSRRAMLQYVDGLLGRRPSIGARLAARRADIAERAREARRRGATGLAGTLLYQVERTTSLPVYRYAKRLYRRSP